VQASPTRRLRDLCLMNRDRRSLLQVALMPPENTVNGSYGIQDEEKRFRYASVI